MHFFTDLDNTLLYSHRHLISEPMVWVEQLNGRNQSFMTERTYRYLKAQNWLNIIPVTTRTLSQYSRLQPTLQELGWREALICNGAIRMLDGTEDMQWTEESLRLSAPSADCFHRMYALAAEAFGTASIVLVEPFLFYVKGEDGAFDFLSAHTDKEQLSIFADARKAYCIPKVLNKGNAVQRYKKRFGVQRCMAAGDSAFDVPMLEAADVRLCPEQLGEFLEPENTILCEGLFSDRICEELKKRSKTESECWI